MVYWKVRCQHWIGSPLALEKVLEKNRGTASSSEIPTLLLILIACIQKSNGAEMVISYVYRFIKLADNSIRQVQLEHIETTAKCIARHFRREYY